MAAYLEVCSLSYTYLAGTPLTRRALDNISFSVSFGEGVGIVGKTGSGKTTLLSHLNGLLKGTSGTVKLDGVPFFSKECSMEMVRRRIGLLFQFPEWQLFAPTVMEDVAFGLIQMGVSQGEHEKKVCEALELVNLEPEKYMLKDPFFLSGGEMRRVALAGILVTEPEILILDEPTIGLDPVNRSNFLSLLSRLQHKREVAIIAASHNLEDLLQIADRIIVLEEGRIIFDGSVHTFLDWDEDRLRSLGLVLPQFSKLLKSLKLKFPAIKTNCTTLKEAKEEILRCLCMKKKC